MGTRLAGSDARIGRMAAMSVLHCRARQELTRSQRPAPSPLAMSEQAIVDRSRAGERRRELGGAGIGLRTLARAERLERRPVDHDTIVFIDQRRSEGGDPRFTLTSYRSSRVA